MKEVYNSNVELKSLATYTIKEVIQLYSVSNQHNSTTQQTNIVEELKLIIAQCNHVSLDLNFIKFINNSPTILDNIFAIIKQCSTINSVYIGFEPKIISNITSKPIIIAAPFYITILSDHDITNILSMLENKFIAHIDLDVIFTPVQAVSLLNALERHTHIECLRLVNKNQPEFEKLAEDFNELAEIITENRVKLNRNAECETKKQEQNIATNKPVGKLALTEIKHRSEDKENISENKEPGFAAKEGLRKSDNSPRVRH